MLQDYLVILGIVMDTLWVREGLLNLIFIWRDLICIRWIYILCICIYLHTWVYTYKHEEHTCAYTYIYAHKRAYTCAYAQIRLHMCILVLDLSIYATSPSIHITNMKINCALSLVRRYNSFLCGIPMSIYWGETIYSHAKKQQWSVYQIFF